MATLGYKDPEVLEKKDIALRQLRQAIRLFTEEQFICSLTLAGAAEEILARLLQVEGKEPALEVSYGLIRYFREILDLCPSIDQKSKREMFNEWNHARNRVKHHDSAEALTIELNDCDEAYWMIRRALKNAKDLGLDVSNKIDFENWLIVNVNL